MYVPVARFICPLYLCNPPFTFAWVAFQLRGSATDCGLGNADSFLGVFKKGSSLCDKYIAARLMLSW